MAIINYLKKEIHVKIVYCGPALSGKTTNLQWLNQNLREKKVGKLISLATKTDRTLFFDLLAVSLGRIRGFDARIQLFTTPGQVFYNSTRKLVLKGADGLVFVADSQEAMKESNIESLLNLQDNLSIYDRKLADFPIVFQYNKRDLKRTLLLEDLQKDLNPKGAPFFETSALKGKGIIETFNAISKLTIQNLKGLPDSYPPSPKTLPSSSPPTPGASTPLQVKKWGQPQVQSEGQISIPVVLINDKNKEEYNLTLEIQLDLKGKDGHPMLGISLKNKS